jgi:hypothetical protein
MFLRARLALALVRAKLASGRASNSMARSARRAITDGIVWGTGLVVAAVAALTALICVTGCPAPPPPANGSISVAWTIRSGPGGLPITCEQVDARFAALRLRNRATNTVVSTAFPCANSPGTAQVAPGLYDVSFQLNGADGFLLGTAPDQTNVSVISARRTDLAPVTFIFGATPPTTLVLRIATSATTNCRPTSLGGAGITGNTITLVRSDGGCAPVRFIRRRGTEDRGTYQVNCSSPEIAPCIEKDETLTTTLGRGEYDVSVRGRIGAANCWARDDTLTIPVGGNVSRTLGLQRTPGAGCPP